MVNVEQFKSDIEHIFSDLEFTQVNAPDGVSTYLYGPFGSFIFILNDPQYQGTDGFLVSVNGDAFDLVFLIADILKVYPELVCFGPFSEKIDGNGITTKDEEIVEHQRAFCLEKAYLIQMAFDAQQQANQSSLIVPPQQEIITHV